MTTDDGSGSLEAAARAVREAECAVAFTGAGASTESGVPAFRGEDGVWTRFDEADFTVDRFRHDPDGFWDDWVALHDAMLGDDVAPNPAHDALADLEAAGHLDAVVTQNVDGLHRRAGSEDVVELHGRGDRAVCRDCGAEVSIRDALERADSGAPRCDCGGPLKPDAVLFGERLPERALTRARLLAARSDAFLVVGSSLSVEPAASLPRTAEREGATLVIVNREPTPLANRPASTFRDPAGEVLPALVDRVIGRD